MTLDHNSQQPLVSVLTPTYNRPEYLKEALSSAIGQTYQNIEIVVSDNCSPQDIQGLIESFNDKRIRFSRNESNLGMIGNTLKVFKMAKGKYVACLLDDDMWEPEFLSKLVPILEANSNLAVAFSDHYVMNANSEIDQFETEKCSRGYKRATLKEGIYQPFYKLGLVDKSVPTAMSTLIRREVVDWDSIPTDVGGSWDVYLTYLCCRSGLGAYYYPEKLTRYRQHEQTETMLSGSRRDVHIKMGKAKADAFCYEQFMNDEKLQEFKPYFQQRWAFLNTTIGVAFMRTEQMEQARSYFWRSLKQNFSFRAVAALALSFSPPSLASRF
ncbi:glycosyltransferase [Aetokthonos hydrillicola Thurmond2011]|jgi:glycosyltransferase involved in cell wall biosynthesis|uniref:Glycosyltransferase n=1 Tax=Aetokthonos hydrillicola Thurmond2011 TaxID=2712845 RepID=A0AAP5IG70_9CYAN|nr:glycosyltransferase family 2 protein [Aetokthonos hydrillicola]MBO3461308.1 glycosyltransferase [Aetokthonos hydrillicola CCALA 1050]MBW4589646.1 glycosyltransferase [Aetokthonos hydrillicola CCALA 1050]MDR9899143.1 glycosyltransferase [Aetokthonos hydrillicola Thurmond2011]